MLQAALLSADPGATALLEAARRAARGGTPRTVLLLHRQQVGTGRPHHGRVARAILADAAFQLDGELFRLAGGGLALLCNRQGAAEDSTGPDADGKNGLHGVLCRLFSVEPASAQRLFTRLHLPQDNEALARHLREPVPLQPPSADPGPTAWHPPPVLQQETTIRLHKAAGHYVMEPAFRTVRFKPLAVATQAASLLQAVISDLRQGGPAAGPHSGALHLPLTLPSLFTPGFRHLLEACTAHGRALGVELSLLDLCADPAAAAAARRLLAGAGVRLVLADASPQAARLLRLGALGADLVMVPWSAQLAGRGAAIAKLSPERLVLAQADTPEALHWGLEYGVCLFQGRQADALLAAHRIAPSLIAALPEAAGFNPRPPPPTPDRPRLRAQ